MIVVPGMGTAVDVPCFLMTAVIDRIGLARKDIATMPLVAENLNDGIGCPKGGVSLVGSLLERNKGICDLLRRVSVQIHIKSQFYGVFLIGIDFQATVCVLVIAQQRRGQRKTVVQSHTQRGLHASASRVGLFLGHR